MRKNQKGETNNRRPPDGWPRRYRWVFAGLTLQVLALALLALTRFESYTSLYDAEYVGSESCGECHSVTYNR